MSLRVVIPVALAVLVCRGPRGRDPSRWRSPSTTTATVRRVEPVSSLAGALAAVSSELRSGRSPEEAWRGVLGCPSGPDGVPAAGDLLGALARRPAGWRRAGWARAQAGGVRRGPVRHGPSGSGPLPHGQVRPGDAALARRVAAVVAAGRLAAALGSPLAPALDRIAESLAADDEVDSERRAALAGPRSTATVLGWLPVAGLALGTALGADPWGVVLSGGLGTLAAVAGAGLLVVGRWWTAQLVRRATLAGSA